MFSIGRSQALPKDVTFEISDDASATVGLADGVRQRCAALFVGGIKMPSGTYGSATSGAQYAGLPVAAHFSGNGTLTVFNSGFSVILR